MNANRKRRHAIVVFSLASLVGPGLALVSSLLKLDTMSSPAGSEGVATFMYDFVLLIWPLQAFGVIEAVVGTLGALVLTVGANVVLYASLGWLRATLCTRPALSFVLWIGIMGMMFALAIWASGNDLRFLNLPALILAGTLFGALIGTTGAGSLDRRSS